MLKQLMANNTNVSQGLREFLLDASESKKEVKQELEEKSAKLNEY
jgi:hypothetical protein